MNIPSQSKLAVRLLRAFALLIAGFAPLWLSGCSGEAVQIGTVVEGDIKEFVDEQAVTSLPNEQVVSMPFAGRIGNITYHPGDPIEMAPNGSPVAIVDPEELALEVAEAEAAVARLNASIAETSDKSVEKIVKLQTDLFVKSSEETVEAASVQLTSSQAKVTYTKEMLGIVEDLYEQGANTIDEFRRARLDYIEADVDHTTNGFTRSIADLMYQATKLTPEMVNEYMNRKDLQVTVLEKQRAEADIKLRQAKLRQNRSTIYSPINGVVLKRHIESEQFLAAGTALISVGDLGQLQVESEILSQDVVSIRLGDTAAIYGPATGADVADAYFGRVTRISPQGEETTSSLGVQQQRVNVTISFDADELARLQTERTVGVGFQVRARIFTDEKKQTLVAPRSAFFRSPDGGWRVYVVKGGIAVQTSVEVGLANDQQFEVVKGLNSGDQLILAPSSSLVDGARVSPLP
ncbi:MAG: efflux RND transporter periplasmic adaptor subunit [bacterium]|nr:efflux RND transporter periplasmic adaptor subunit [bacterium]